MAGKGGARRRMGRTNWRLALVRWLQVVQAELAARVFVELAVQLSAVGASVVLADKPLMPHGIAHDPGLLDQDLLLQAVDYLLPSARLDVIVQHDNAVRMWLAPHHSHLAAPLVVGVDDRP